MGWFSKSKGGEKSGDPAKEIRKIIAELEEQRRLALEELLAFKTGEKDTNRVIEEHHKKIAHWQRRAMAAVKKDADDLAKKCLKEKKLEEMALRKAQADRDEARRCALELNRSRKTVDAKLKILKLKQSTLANQIAAARAGSTNLLGFDEELFDKLAQAEAKIESEELLLEAQAEMAEEDLGSFTSAANPDDKVGDS